MPNLPADKLLLHQATQFLEDAISFMANEGDLITFAQHLNWGGCMIS